MRGTGACRRLAGVLGNARLQSASAPFPLRLAQCTKSRSSTTAGEERDKRKITGRLTSVDMGLFTGPHQTSLFDDSSSTIRLSEGERPVLAPE